MQIKPKDPNKIYVKIEHLAVIGGLVVLATILAMILSIISYFK